MKVEDKRKLNKDITFEELFIGDSFEYEGDLWVKCGDDVALNLKDDFVDDFGEQCQVREVKIRIIVED